jgi:RNA-directed DNA polymerase
VENTGCQTNEFHSSFHPNSYGYRSGKRAHQALAKAVTNCGYHSWVVELEIKGFFDNLDDDLLIVAVKRYTGEKWILIYIERWLKAGVSKGAQNAAMIILFLRLAGSTM